MRNTGGRHAADYVPRVPLLSPTPPPSLGHYYPGSPEKHPLGSIDRINPLGGRPRASLRPFVPGLPFTDLLIAPPRPFRFDSADGDADVALRARATSSLPPSPPGSA